MSHQGQNHGQARKNEAAKDQSLGQIQHLSGLRRVEAIPFILADAPTILKIPYSTLRSSGNSAHSEQLVMPPAVEPGSLGKRHHYPIDAEIPLQAFEILRSEMDPAFPCPHFPVPFGTQFRHLC